MRLEHRVVFVTGASRGIGRAIALACAREGADVVITSREEAPGSVRSYGTTIHDVVSEVERLGRKALALKFDLRIAEECEAAVGLAKEQLGRIDALVHNAGALWSADVVETPIKKFDAIIGVHVRAAFALSRAVLPYMVAQRYGHIVMMAPPLDAARCAHHSVYAISKLGMTMLAQAIAGEVAEHNVTAHALWPAAAIESQATAHLSFGFPEVWRRADIVADATVALLAREPSARQGRAWTDEDVLRAEGVTDFSQYDSVPATDPQPPPFSSSQAPLSAQK